MVSVIPPLTGVPFRVGSDATLLGDVGLLQPSSIAPSAPPKIVRDAAWVQNLRRVWTVTGHVLHMFHMFTTSPADVWRRGATRVPACVAGNIQK